MAFPLSPSVTVTEQDLTNIIPAVATSRAAIVGEFNWGPVEDRVFVANETELTNIFGATSDANYIDHMVASSFLAYASDLQVVRVVGAGALNASATESAGGVGLLVKNKDHYDTLSFTASTNLWLAKCPGTLGNAIGVAWADASGFGAVDSNGDNLWPWKGLFSTAPESNEFHVVVYDATGGITGTAGTALEKFEFVSTSTAAKKFDGSTAYFKEVINNGSAWLWVGKTSLLSGTNNGVTLAGGSLGSAATSGDKITGWDIFADADTTDVSLLIQGNPSVVVGQNLIQELAEVRKDCVAFVSPLLTDVVNVSKDQALDNMLATRTSYGSSSYAAMDSAWKLMYDRYNDVNRWVPLNGDFAGICARTDNEYDPWFPPGGFNRGRLKNTIKLVPDQSSKNIRDVLYQNGINPCLVFPADGPIILGDKTLQTKPSAFDRINVRRLFIVLEKAIATASKYTLFEFNDDVTRSRFVNQVEPFLRDVQGRQGIYEFKVVSNDKNNTAEVIDRNEFVADIYIKPARSINFIRLNFIAVRTGVAFEEIVQSA